MRLTVSILISIILFTSCRTARPAAATTPAPDAKTVLGPGTLLDISRKDFIQYAHQFMGTPYLYGSSNPVKGLDCSGLLYVIFQYYKIASPRSSYDYETVGKTTSLAKARAGDILLFTASNPDKIGHMGIITATAPTLQFIHASTSKGVIISDFKGYYKDHFVKAIQILR